jgi:hypothetical protein
VWDCPEELACTLGLFDGEELTETGWAKWLDSPEYASFLSELPFGGEDPGTLVEFNLAVLKGESFDAFMARIWVQETAFVENTKQTWGALVDKYRAVDALHEIKEAADFDALDIH